MNADALEERRRVVLGRLLCEMESLPAPMYGEMVDALRALLATPNTLPPVAVGDVVALDMEGYGRAETTVDADGDVLVVALNGYEDTPERTHEHYSDDAITAVYRRIWQRKETDRG